MTVHAAKGLEFDVVVLADQGRERAARGLPDVLVSSDGRVAMRAPDANGVLRPAIGYTAAAKAEREAEREEGRRLQYVAMTRARQHLIVSGALLPGEQTSIAEVCRLLEIGLDDEGDVDRGEASLAVRVDAAGGARGRRERRAQGARPRGRAAAPRWGRSSRSSPTAGAWRPRSPPLAEIPAAAPVPVRRLSYSALALYGRCGYRYFAQRVLGLPEPVIAPEPDEGLGPLEVGDAVHLELERPDGRWRDLYPMRPRPTSERIAGVRRRVVGLRAPRARRRPRPRPARGAVRVRGGRRALPRPVRRLRARGRRLGAGRRLQDEPPRRARRAGGDGPHVRGAGDDLRPGGAADGRAGRRGGLRLPGAGRRGRDAAVRGRRRGGRSRPSCRRRSRPSARASSRPGRASSAASARRSTCSAPARGSSGRAEGAARPRRRDPRPAARPASRRHDRAQLVDAARAARRDDPLGPVHGRAREPGDRRPVPAVPAARRTTSPCPPRSSSRRSARRGSSARRPRRSGDAAPRSSSATAARCRGRPPSWSRCRAWGGRRRPSWRRTRSARARGSPSTRTSAGSRVASA